MSIRRVHWVGWCHIVVTARVDGKWKSCSGHRERILRGLVGRRGGAPSRSGGEGGRRDSWSIESDGGGIL